MTGKLKRYDVGYDQSGEMVSEEAHGEYVKFFYVEAFLRELIAMAEEANAAPNTVTAYYNYGDGYSHAMEQVADRARALLGEEAP